jgi:acyl carrier protein phosphodiesterase
MSDDLLIVSNSEIQTFKRCRRKWHLQYYRKLVPIREEVVGVRSIGTRVHAVVAEWYDVQARGEEPDADSIMALHDSLVLEDIIAQPEKSDDISKDADMSRAMCEGYFTWLEETGADEGITPIAIEEEVAQVITTPVTHTPVEIRAKLDLRITYKGPDEEPQDLFMDHKSVAEFTTPTRVLHLDEQMLLYDWLLRWQNLFVTGAIYNMIRRVKRTKAAKPPFFNRMTINHSPQQLRSFHNRLMGELEAIIAVRTALDSGVDPMMVAFPTPNRNCHWDCDFFDVCGLIDRPDDKPDHYLSLIFEEGDPYARYKDMGSSVE